jgi:hypothetical protein
MAPAAFPPYSDGMKANHKKRALTFGNLIETVYGICGNRNARGIIRLGLDAHVIVFQEYKPAFDFNRIRESV